MAPSNTMAPGSERVSTQQAQAGSNSPKPQPVRDLVTYLKNCARDKPEAAALWCVGIGFVLGWKLKPW